MLLQVGFAKAVAAALSAKKVTRTEETCFDIVRPPMGKRVGSLAQRLFTRTCLPRKVLKEY